MCMLSVALTDPPANDGTTGGVRAGRFAILVIGLIGGGSGHGFKMGPALGEYVSRLVLDGEKPHDQFTYARFSEGRERVSRTKRRKLHS